MFVAPMLYFIHAVLTGISVFIAAYMHWISGFSFSVGLVDIALWVRNPLATHWYMLIPQGLAFFVIYYAVFRFTINKFNLMTPGRELAVAGEETDGYDTDVSADKNENDITTLTRRYVDAIGSYDILTSINACITRLRLNAKGAARVDDALAKRLGASSVIRLNKQSVRVIVGTRAELIASAMYNLVAADPAAEDKPQDVLG